MFNQPGKGDSQTQTKTRRSGDRADQRAKTEPRMRQSGFFGIASNIGDFGSPRRLSGGAVPVWIFIIRFPVVRSRPTTRLAQSLWARLLGREGGRVESTNATQQAQSFWVRLAGREG